ncbi:MAG: DUF2442 domain-containing protein [Bacteroidetes bacterium]|nr:DUF2442 domain-containing protein [Bacteroidota bacterium]MCL5737155.1 DUF2442 domain-containing protein [Bacteroidota bacterium]
MNPRVKAVKAKDNYKLEIIFSSGEVGIYDCSPLLNFGVFSELKDKVYFQQVRVSYGTVVWPHEQDICPDTLYLDSIKIKKMPNKSLQRTGTKSRASR